MIQMYNDGGRERSKEEAKKASRSERRALATLLFCLCSSITHLDSMPAIAKESWQRVKLPALKLSWSSLGLSPSQSGANNIAYSNVKGNRQSVVVRANSGLE
jgi:hypothetical protein